jgi:hypothetical protein
MMDYKTKLRALIALNAALALALVIGALTAPERRSSSVIKISLASGLEGVRGIGISSPGLELRLQKRAESWLVADATGSLPADSSRVEGLVNALAALTSAERVASSRASWAELGLGEERAARLILTDFSGKTLLELLVGDYTPSGSGAYAAFADGQDAWALPAGAAAYIKAAMNSWLDLRVFPSAISTQDIQQIRVRGGLDLEDGGVRSLDYTLRRSGAGWVLDGQALDPLRVDAMARSLVSLRAAQYAAGGDALVPGAERIWAELALGSGEALRLALGARGEDGRYLASSSGRERGFYLPGWAVEEAFKPISALVPAP